jgi:uncharacterized protein
VANADGRRSPDAYAAYLEWFVKAVPAAQAGHTSGLFLYTFAGIAAVFLLVSFRTTVFTVLTLVNLVLTLALLGAGYYGGNTTLLQIGGITGIVLAAQALYMAAAELSEYTYGRSIVPLWPLSGS